MRMIWNGLHLENPARSVTLSHKTSNPSMLSEKLYFDLKRQTPFQCIFEGKIAIFLFVSGLYLQA
jgi:hypothetical protein